MPPGGAIMRRITSCVGLVEILVSLTIKNAKLFSNRQFLISAREETAILLSKVTTYSLILIEIFVRLVVLTLLSYCCSCTLTCERFFSFFFVFFKLERTASEPFLTSSVDLGRTKSHRFLSDLIAWMHCTFAVYTCYSLKLPSKIKELCSLEF